MKTRLLATQLAVALALFASTSSIGAQEKTQLLVRVTASDAKIVGSGVGGVRITVRELASGRVLAEGIQEGGTGNTRTIMFAKERGGTIYDTDGAAGFLAELSIDEPTIVEIVAEGPLGTPDALRRSTKTMLMLPGQHVLGEGVILEIQGFTVQMETPGDGPVARGAPFEVRGKVTMLCGCPTQPGGMWDSDDYRILIRASQGDRMLGEWPMEFAGETSWYTTEVTLDVTGDVDLTMIAMDASKGNFGMTDGKVTVR
jgi:hypothetical protein